MMDSSNTTISSALPPAQAAPPLRLHKEIAVSAELVGLSQCDPATALRRLDCGDTGLDAAQAAERLRRCGPNQIAQEHRTGVLYELINRTKNPLNALLLTLAVASWFLGDVRAAVIIAMMVIRS